MSRPKIRWSIVWPWAKRVWNGDATRRQSPRVGIWVAVAVLATSISLLILLQAAFSVMVAQGKANMEYKTQKVEATAYVYFLRGEEYLSMHDVDRVAIDKATQVFAKKNDVTFYSGPTGETISSGLVMTPEQYADIEQLLSTGKGKELRWNSMIARMMDRSTLNMLSVRDARAEQGQLPVVWVPKTLWEEWGAPKELMVWRGVMVFTPLGPPRPLTKRFSVMPIASTAPNIVLLNARSFKMWTALGRGQYLSGAPLGGMHDRAEGDWIYQWHGSSADLKAMEKDMQQWVANHLPQWRIGAAGSASMFVAIEEEREKLLAKFEAHFELLVVMQGFLLGILALMMAAQSGWALRWLCRQRQADIAVLKTLGWSSQEVAAAFVLVATGIGLGAAVCGWALGLAWVELGNHLITNWGDELNLVPRPMEFAGPKEAVWVLASIAWTALIALWPSWSAAQQNPALLFSQND